MIVDMLLQYGADLCIPDKAGNLPMHLACTMGHAECVRALLKYGGNPTVPNLAGDPAIHLACQGVHADAVRIIMQRTPRAAQCVNRVSVMCLHDTVLVAKQENTLVFAGRRNSSACSNGQWLPGNCSLSSYGLTC